MKPLLKSWSFLNKYCFLKPYKSLALVGFLCSFSLEAQRIGNYVNNGSFEFADACSPSPTTKPVKYWSAIDTSLGELTSVASICYSTAPLNGFTYQWPRSGNNYEIGGFFCQPPHCSLESNRNYYRNKLKRSLQNGKAYCVKFYINISGNSTYGMDGFGVYFGDNSLDTIKKIGVPLTYLMPQVQNPNNNIITDTLGWTQITGTFVANGTEKFLIIGNFKSDASTNKVFINSLNLPLIFTDVCIDDVSCIEMNLPAYAGRDTTVLPGSSVFLGREPDFAIDSGCIWYKLPNMATPIATVSGLFVNPASTSTYVVKQILDCSPEKWDTVVVKIDPTVGILSGPRAKSQETSVELFPNPATELIYITIKNPDLVKFDKLKIYNSLGQLVSERATAFKSNNAQMSISDLSRGIYLFAFITDRNETIIKKLVISK